MRALTPPAQLVPALNALDGAFAEVVPALQVAMGGGSVLAARWDHRDSTDIDLFIPLAAMVPLINENRLAYDRLAALLESFGEAQIESPTP